MVAEVAAVEEQVLEGDVGQVALLPEVELVLDRLADPAHRRLRQRGLRAQGLGQGGLDVSHRQAPDEAGDDQGLQGVGAAHAHPQQPGGEGLVGAPQLRALDGDGPGRGLDGRRAVAVAATGTNAFAVGVALPAQELCDLGFDRGLDEEAHAEAPDLLQDVGQVTVGGEQVVDVGADALQGGYSGGHGCGFLSLLGRLERNLRSSSIYTGDWTPPAARGEGRRNLLEHVRIRVLLLYRAHVIYDAARVAIERGTTVEVLVGPSRRPAGRKATSLHVGMWLDS